MQTITKKEFNQLVSLCEQYDPFTQYIDSYKQEIQAEKYNKVLSDTFNEIVAKFGIKANGIPWTCENKGRETSKYVEQYLAEKEIVVEKRVWMTTSN